MKAPKNKPNLSVLKGEATFHLDERTKKSFASFVKKAKKQKFDPRQHSQTIICGPAEFTTSKKTNNKNTNKKYE